ncbi:MAG: HPr family phosphocarrier protein [Oscillospiraceae bacterium]|jgi:phosphotransferase system HPr-like phosphotransfer protein|nr:HPr family phosphocarrier protein [Oscillospiraceae bacterium]MDR1328592.1 HPr family phosphocarrier protein [Oscillospiraceae bacterium]
MVFKILINNSEEAQELNRIASKYSYDIQVQSKNGQADAKSLLGTMLLTMESDLKLITADGADTRALEADLKPYIVSYI